MKAVLADSPNVKVKESGATLGTFTGAAYDNINGKPSVLAKACLLNLYAKLTTLKEPHGESWFSFVKEILVIGQERFIAVVKPEMGEIVRLIKKNLAHFTDYKDTPAQNHFGNFPTDYQINKNKMFSVKTIEDHANIQLTFAPGTHPDTGADVLLLDADIDENGKLLAHLADLFKHKINGGTHPFDIHEYLKDSQTTHHAQPLGYKLV